MKKLFQTLNFALLLIGHLNSCQQKKNIEGFEYFKKRHFTLLEPSKAEEHYFTDSLKSFWKADTTDLLATEQIIISAINELTTEKTAFTVETLPYFMRQYICFINEQDERIIWVNAHCHLEKRPPDVEVVETEFQTVDWRNKLVIVDDDGDCHWRILINLDKQTYSNFIVNGV